MEHHEKGSVEPGGIVFQPARKENQGSRGMVLPSPALPSLGSERVLIVDDEKILRNMAALILASHGYRTFQAENAEEALEVVASSSEAIQAVILDLSMPGMGGMAALPRLRAMDEQMRILITTGDCQFEHSVEFKTSSAAGILAKPFRSGELLAKLREVLDA